MTKKRLLIIAIVVAVAVGAAAILYLTLSRQPVKEDLATTCWMNYIDDGNDAVANQCARGSAIAYQNFDDDPAGMPGDFPIIIEGINLEGLLWSDLNVGKFEANNEFTSQYASDIEELRERGEAPPMMGLRLSELKENFTVVIP